MPVHGFKERIHAETLKQYAHQRLLEPQQADNIEQEAPLPGITRVYWFKPDAVMDGATYDSANDKYVMGMGEGTIWVRKKKSSEESSQNPDNTITFKDLVKLKNYKDEDVKRQAFNLSPAKVGTNWPVPVIQDCYGDLYIQQPELFLGKSNAAINKGTGTANNVSRWKGHDRTDAGFDETVRNEFANITATGKWLIYAAVDGGLYIIAAECPL